MVPAGAVNSAVADHDSVAPGATVTEVLAEVMALAWASVKVTTMARVRAELLGLFAEPEACHPPEATVHAVIATLLRRSGSPLMVSTDGMSPCTPTKGVAESPGEGAISVATACVADGVANTAVNLGIRMTTAAAVTATIPATARIPPRVAQPRLRVVPPRVGVIALFSMG